MLYSYRDHEDFASTIHMLTYIPRLKGLLRFNPILVLRLTFKDRKTFDKTEISEYSIYFFYNIVFGNALLLKGL